MKNKSLRFFKDRTLLLFVKEIYDPSDDVHSSFSEFILTEEHLKTCVDVGDEKVDLNFWGLLTGLTGIDTHSGEVLIESIENCLRKNPHLLHDDHFDPVLIDVCKTTTLPKDEYGDLVWYYERHELYAIPSGIKNQFIKVIHELKATKA
jgi:hypothetical protein